MLEAAVKATCEYIAASQQPGTSSEVMAHIKSARVDALKSAMGRISTDLPDLTRAISAINDSPFEDAQKQELLMAVHSTGHSVSHVAGDAHGTSKAQHHAFVFNYLPLCVWLVLEDKCKSELERCMTMVQFLHSIGLFFPNVITVKTIVATMMLAQGASPTPLGAKALYDCFNSQNKSMRPLRRNAPITMLHFPEKVQDFMTSHPTAYPPDKPPVESRVADKQVGLLAPSLAARNTHQWLKPTAPAIQMCPQQNMPSPNTGAQALMAMATQVFQLMSGQQQSRNLVDLQPPLPSRLPAPLMIANGPAVGGDATDGPPNLAAGDVLPVSLPPAVVDDEPPAGIVDAEADIDAYLDLGLSKPPKKKAKVMKKPSAAPRAATAAPGASTTPPNYGTTCPCFYNGCKIYEGRDAYRIMPKPGLSKYDKRIPFNSDQEAAWSKAMDYCQNPIIPPGSVNCV